MAWGALTAVLAVLAVVLVPAEVSASAGTTLTPYEKYQRRTIKQQVYGNQALSYASQVSAGAAQPVVEFSVSSSPPSIFVNYVVPDDKAAAFAAAIPLPPGFSPAKVRIVESDPEPRYWLSLNVYNVRGITTGLRAEWSTYVDDGSGTPRFMIVRARTGQFSVDPIGPLAWPEPFNHSLGGDNVVRTSMLRTRLSFGFLPTLTSANLFTSTIALPAPQDRNYVVPTREWVEANDYIYWRNGVNDHAFHNSKAHSPALISVNLADVTIQDDSDWVQFTEPAPAHVLVYLDELPFVVGPWWNVTDPDGRVAPGKLASLQVLKKRMYGGLGVLSALNVLAGRAEPAVRTSIDSAPPSVYWHWRIPAAKVPDLQAALGLAPGLSLAPVRLQDDDTEADYWLTLNVYKLARPTTGLRAEWSTYVDDGDGVHRLVIESRANEASLDPVNLNTPPYPVAHALDGTNVDTTVGSGPTAFTSTFALPPEGSRQTVLASRDSVGARDLTYWRNGIADRVSYDGALLNAELTSVDPGDVTVTDGSPWAAFSDGHPDRVWVHQGAYDLVVNPWWNLNRI